MNNERVRISSIVFLIAIAVGIGVGLIVWDNLGMGLAIGAALGLIATFFEPKPKQDPLDTRHRAPATSNGKLNFMYIGLAAGIVIGAIFAHVEYDEWLYGALIGSGLGPLIAFILQRRFGDG